MQGPEPRVGDPDGFGRYGILDETEDGSVLCSDCGWTGAHLGLHLYKAHGRGDAVSYRERHGLLRGRGLVAATTRETIRAKARAGMDERPGFVELRDPAAALRARVALGRGASPEEVVARDARMVALGKRRRREVVVECEWCLVVFCPIVGYAGRRRYCIRGCASKATRRGGWSIARARAVAGRLVGDLPARRAHVRAVGALAEDLVRDGVIEPQLAAAAWLHDIGYAPALAATGFHPLDGARYLKDQGAPAALISLVGWHTGASFEAEERGLRTELESLPRPDPGDLQVVTLLDLVVGPLGRLTTPAERIEEILQRYPAGHSVHRAVARSAPKLLAETARTRTRLRLAADWPSR